MVLIHRPRDPSDPHYSHQNLDYSHAYAAIQKAARSRAFGSAGGGGGGAVLILVSPDVDALCAARIFTALLRDDEVPHRVIPVEGYRCLHRIMEEDVVGNEELHTLLLINLGSVLSLPTYLDLPPHCTAHILDSHRPWNLDNLFATGTITEKIWIWDDGDVTERLGAEQKAYEALEFELESGSEDSESDVSEDESEEDEEEETGSVVEGDDAAAAGTLRRKRRHASHDGSDAESSTSGRPRPRRRKKQRVQRMPREERYAKRAVLSRYYSRGTSVGMSVAGQMYLLASSLGRMDNDSLWLAILGLTSQYMSSAVPYETYDDYSAALASDVIAMNPLPTAIRGPNNGAVGQGRPFDPDDASIRVVPEELRFTLYRHWSLENSMYHTAYVAAKLGIWRERGMSRLRGLLAKMGFSLSNCRQTYEHMDLDLRNTLVKRMESIAPEYGLTELLYRSFVRSVGFRSAPLSAADAVEGVSALLQAAHGVRIEIEAPGYGFGGAAGAGVNAPLASRQHQGAGGGASELFGTKRLWSLGFEDTTKKRSDGDEKENVPMQGSDQRGGNEAEEEGEKQDVEKEEPHWVKNFFAAYNALDSRRAGSVALLRSSLHLSKALHKAVISQGVALIDKQAIKTLRSFRLAVLRDGPDLALFAHPATLTRLGLWLVDALRDLVADQDARRRKSKVATKGKGVVEEEEKTRAMPFVLASLDEKNDSFVVVGVTGAPDFGDVRKNRFGLAFQEAAQRSGARTRHDQFETSVVEVRREDFAGFVEALHLRA